MFRKKLIVSSVVLGLLLSLHGCGNTEVKDEKERETQTTQQEQPTQKESEQESVSETTAAETVEADINAQSMEFDDRFEGVWVHVSEEQRGDMELNMGSVLFFLYDGRFYGDTLYAYEHLAMQGIACPRANTQDNTIDIMNKAFQFGQDNPEVVGMEEFDASLFDVTVSYEFSDIQESQRSANDPAVHYYKKYDNDLLTMHMTGTYQESPVNISSIDATFVFEKDYPIYGKTDFFIPSMEGTWKDSMGNVWKFEFLQTEPEHGAEPYRFQLTDSSGKEYEGTDITTYWDADDPDCKERVRFSFTEQFVTPKYTIVDFDGSSLVLKDEKGTDLVLSRQ